MWIKLLESIGAISTQSFLDNLMDVLKTRAPYTYMHSQHVAWLSAKLAIALGLSTEEAKEIQLAAWIYDLGKITWSDELLMPYSKIPTDKKVQLSDESFIQMKEHPKVAIELLENYNLPKNVIAAIKHHHDNYDGSGNPDGLSGEAIPISARIIKIADCFLAVIHQRPYRLGPTKSIDQAINEVKAKSGTWFDPKIVRKLEEMLPTLKMLFIPEAFAQ